MIELLFVGSMLAGDQLPAKTVLQRESYVMSIEEATKLKARIEDLEKKEKLLGQYVILNELLEKQSGYYKKNIEFQDLQIKKYESLMDSKDDQIKILLKQESSSFAKKIILFGSGVLMTAGSIYVADKLDDSIEKN